MEDDTLHLQNGLDTMIGAKGVKLSGGQRHCTAAMRMFIRDPKLLVFDDLSSADRIILMQNGRIVGMGSLSELLEDHEEMQSLWIRGICIDHLIPERHQVWSSQ